MATYLVTGAAGFIGSNIVETLLNLGHRVVGLDNFSAGFRQNLEFTNAHHFTMIEGDIRVLETCERAVQGVDYVLHEAALGSVPKSIEEPLLYNENNATGTLNILEASRKANVKRFVLASSSSVYGDTPVLPKIETMLPTPKSPYAVSKLVGECYCRVYFEAYGLPTVALRYFNVFGPRQNPNSQYAAAIPKFVTAALKNESPIVFGDGEQTRDFTFVQNVVDANLKACEASLSSCGLVYNVGCGYRISINNLIATIQKLTESKAKIEYQPIRLGDVKDSLADVEKSKACLNLNPFVSLEEGLRQTLPFYQKMYGAVSR